MTTFSKNLKRFRIAKNMTQGQVADLLGVSAQSVSRWECNIVLPDVTILPEIARLYCVSIDDFYKENSIIYESYAQMLGSIYQTTHKLEDYLRADGEYKELIRLGNATMQDFLSYGILNQYMMKDCFDKAISLYMHVLQRNSDEDPEVYQKTQLQNIYLQCQMGKNEEIITRQLKQLNENTQDANEWINLIAAYMFSRKYQEAAVWAENAMEKFPQNVILHVFCGDVYRGLQQYEKAFEHWNLALMMDSTCVDALYSKGYCYEEIGEYQKAYETWRQLAEIPGVNEGIRKLVNTL